MWRFFKRLISIALVLVAVALVLNLKIAGRPAREHAMEIWQSEGVQKIYRTVKDRVLALIRKDISVEEVFKPEVQKKETLPIPEPPTTKPPSAQTPDETKVIQMEKLDEADRKALKQILEKSSK